MSYIHVEVVFYSEGRLLEVSAEMLVCITVIHTANEHPSVEFGLFCFPRFAREKGLCVSSVRIQVMSFTPSRSTKSVRAKVHGNCC